MRAAARLAALVLLAVASCDATAPDEATDARLRVKNGQFFRGSVPAAVDGPPVKSVTVSPIVHPGQVGRTCSGELDPAATSVALSIDGDVGYWIVPAGLPSVIAKGAPTFAAELSFSTTLPAGRLMFVARAVDASGHFGAPLVKPLDVTATPRPTGRFVIALTWSGPADLDLHVVDPRGVEIWKRNINSYEPPPPDMPEPPNTPHPGGILDFDSNASCVADGRHAENVVYAEAPPRGRYAVRVDTSSLCGAITEHWRVEGLLDGVSLGAAEGIATDFDTRFPHDRGAGVLALELDVP
ncbi:hypothetical protein BH11MYX4_BH11MYX4_06120 [soil metagenome]